MYYKKINDSYIIRELRKGDYYLSGFYNTLNQLSPAPPHSFEIFRHLYDKRLDANITTLVVMDDEKIIGTGSIFIENKFTHYDGKVGHIEDVVIDKDFQGLDLGKELVKALVEVARQAGTYKVILNCKAELTPFYEQVGFRKHEVLMRMDL